MTTTKTVDALRVELDDLQQRHNAAITQADSARDAKDVTAGRRVLSEATAEELAEAHQALREAEEVAASLASAVALVTTRLSEAEDAEREERRAGLRDAGAQAVKQASKARSTIRRGLSTISDGFTAIDDAQSDRRGIRKSALELRDLDGAVAAIERGYQERYQELLQQLPSHPGMEVNTASLELRQEKEIKAAKAAAEREAAELAPDVGADELQAVVDDFADILPRLVDSATRKALSEGWEFIREPVQVSLSSRHSGYIGRLYSAGEMPFAESRHAAFVAALRRLGAVASPLASPRDARVA